MIKDNVIAWFSKWQICPEDLLFVLDRMSPEQIKNYLEKQAKESEKKPKELIGTWQDYLDMALKLGMDVKDPIIYRVRKLEKRHNELVQLMIELWHRGKSRIFWKKEKNCSTASSEKILILRVW